MEKLIIRKLKVSDAKEITDIYAAIIQKSASSDFIKLIERHAERDPGACLTAELDGKVVGFLISYVMTMGFGVDKSAWIATLGISPPHMGQGIGAAMAQEIFTYYKSLGIERVYTAVRWDSPDLLSFFKTLGFDRSHFINLKKEI